MKLLIAVDSSRGGAGNMAQIISQYLSDKKFDVHLVFLNNCLSNKHETVNVKKYVLNLSGKGWLYKIKILHKVIKEISPDLIISFLNVVSIPILLSQIFSHIPIIVSERSNPFTNVKKKKFKILRNISYMRANIIIVQFKIFEDFVNELFLKKNVLAIPNSIDLPTIYKDYKTQKSTDIVSFVTICTLYSVKRVDLMIRMFEKVYHQHSNVVLNIYGEGKDEEKLKLLIKKLGLEKNVFLRGYTSKIYEVLSENDIYLMTSEREGFPNSLSEAMAVGLPLVAIKCHEGLKEIIKDKINGFLISEGHEGDFVSACCTLIEDSNLRQKMGKKSMYIANGYSINKIMSLWLDVIQKLASQKHIRS